VLDPIGVAWRHIECLRQKQLLRGHPLLFHSAPQFFEQDPLVRGMLIHQDKTVNIFHQDIQLAEYAYDLELLLMSFVGIGTKGLAARQEIADESLLFYAGLLGRHPRSALALKQILSDYFAVPVEVEQFVGKWIRLDPSNQTEFKETEKITERLGYGAVVGDEVWNTQSSVRVRLGPLSHERYLDFLPRPEAKGYRLLQSLLSFYCGMEIDFEVQLVLDRDQTPGLRLTAEESTNSLLGWTTWIKNAPLNRDPAEAVLQLN